MPHIRLLTAALLAIALSGCADRDYATEAKTAIAANDLIKAEAILKEGLAATEPHSRGLLMDSLVMLYVQSGRAAEARQYMQTNMDAVNPLTRFRAYGMLGAYADQAGDLQQAYTDYETASSAGVEAAKDGAAEVCEAVPLTIFSGMRLVTRLPAEGQLGPRIRSWIQKADRLTSIPACANAPRVKALASTVRQQKAFLAEKGL